MDIDPTTSRSSWGLRWGHNEWRVHFHPLIMILSFIFRHKVFNLKLDFAWLFKGSPISLAKESGVLCTKDKFWVIFWRGHSRSPPQPYKVHLKCKDEVARNICPPEMLTNGFDWFTNCRQLFRNLEVRVLVWGFITSNAS